MNKKAQFMQIAQIVRVIVLVFLVFIVYTLISIGIKNEIDIFDAESELIIQRILYAKNGLSYYNKDIDRVYPGLIDYNKFNEEHLVSMFNFDKENDKEDLHLAIKINLRLGDEEGDTIFLNKKWYERWYPLTVFLGAGGKNLRKQELPVNMLKDGEQFVKTLTIWVIMPRD